MISAAILLVSKKTCACHQSDGWKIVFTFCNIFYIALVPKASVYSRQSHRLYDAMFLFGVRSEKPRNMANRECKEQTSEGRTYCVNFQVGDPGSPSTIFQVAIVVQPASYRNKNKQRLINNQDFRKRKSNARCLWISVFSSDVGLASDSNIDRGMGLFLVRGRCGATMECRAGQ